jgi:glycosyltransferase involved in cell wall biosynthesis
VSTPISAVLITKDAERYLGQVLAALQWCDEILIVDSGSVDNTAGIAESCGARFEYQDWLGYGRQKRHAVALASNDWVLSVDADEVVDDKLAAAIRDVDLTSTNPSTVFAVRRRTYIGTTAIDHGVWNPDWVLRFFNRTRSNFSDAPVHEAVDAAGPVKKLGGILHHYSYRDYAEVFRVDYHRLKAQRYRQRGRSASGVTLAFRACWAFINSYVFRLGILDGRAGTVVAVSAALNAVLGLALASDENVDTG